MGIRQLRKQFNDATDMVQSMESDLADAQAEADRLALEIPRATIAKYRGEALEIPLEDLTRGQWEAQNHLKALNLALDEARTDKTRAETALNEAEAELAKSKVNDLEKEIQADIDSIIANEVMQLYHAVRKVTDKFLIIREQAGIGDGRQPLFKGMFSRLGYMIVGILRLATSPAPGVYRSKLRIPFDFVLKGNDFLKMEEYLEAQNGGKK